jgi:putative aldouronate transport system substrate-binding protein
MKKVRVLFIIMALLLLIAAGGCHKATPAPSGAPATTTAPTAAPTPACAKGYDVVSELKAYADVMPLAAFADYGGLEASPTDVTATWIKDNFKIDMSGLTVDATGKYGDAVRAKLAANDLPDMLMCFNYPLFREIAASGSFLNVNDAIENYAPDTIDNISEPVLDKYREKDGKLYLFPSNTIPTNDPNTYVYAQDGMTINSDFLAKTGLQTPTNTTELYNYLKAVSTQQFNGKPVIPMGNVGFSPDSYLTDGYPLVSSHYIQMFAPGTGYQMLVKNDTTKMIDLMYDSPAYLQYLQFFNKLYREKLLDQDAFTMTKDQYIERLKSGAYGFVWGGPTDAGVANTALSNNIMKPYQPIKMIKDYQGSSKTYTFPVLGNWYFLFNKNIKDPVRLAKFIDWQYTLQGVQIINYGAPDKTKQMNVWYYDDAGKVVFDQDLQKKNDAADYTWNWKKAGGWGFHACGLKACIKYTAVNEMGLCMADDMYKAIDTIDSPELTVDPNFEAMTLQPLGPVGTDKGPSLRDLLNKWEVKIIINAKDDSDAAAMYTQMMTEARAAGYDDIKKELYNNYLAANPAK